MKVFVIKNKISEDIFIVGNKKRFCAKFNLTPRLLDYTVEGASSTRFQEWHKNYKIVDKLVFIEDKQGDRVLWDNGLVGYCVKEDGEHFKDKPKAKTVEMENEIEALQKELTKTMKQKQKLQDQLNLNRKLGREQYRYENFIDVFRESCKEMIERNTPLFSGIEYPSFEYNTDGEAILTLSDLHFGQLVNETNNYFDSEIADIRLNRIFNQFEEEVDLRGISKVSILFIGDLIHAQPITNPNKIDMKVSSEFPEIQSSIQCFLTLSKYIDRLIGKYEVVRFAGVVGNESRVHSHVNPSNLQSEARNNYDAVIFEFLKQRYRDYDNAVFLNNGDEIETVVEIGDKQICMIHGNDLHHKDLENSVIKLRTRLEQVYGEIDYTVLGHVHSSNISDLYSRNSSLVGSNSYSNRLGFVESTASQNMIVIDENGIKAMSLKAK